MAMLPMTLGALTPQTTQILAFFVAFHIFVVRVRRDFKIGKQVDRS